MHEQFRPPRGTRYVGIALGITISFFIIELVGGILTNSLALLISMMIGVLIFYSSGRLIRDSMNVLLEGVPSHIDVSALERRIIELKGVKRAHDLHVWCITPTKMCCMSGHVVVKKGTNRKKLITTLINVKRRVWNRPHHYSTRGRGLPKSGWRTLETWLLLKKACTFSLAVCNPS